MSGLIRILKELISKPGPGYSWKKVLWILIGSSCLVSGGASLLYLKHAGGKNHYMPHTEGSILAIIQTTSQTGYKAARLQTAYLAEVLGLSIDQPTMLVDFNLVEAKKKLLATWIIKNVRLKKIKPNLLFIQYSVRLPYAYLEDYSNTAIDEEGVLFPYAPFYPPRNLPSLCLGKNEASSPWGERISPEKLELVMKLVATLGEESIERIDMAHVESCSAGKRELVITLKGGTILRFEPNSCIQQLSHYLILKQTLIRDGHPKLIDFRVPEVAYISSL